MKKINSLLRNNRGDISIATIFLIVALNMLLAFMLLFVSVQIQSMQIRNSVKQELNNLSASIAKDTHFAMRESELVAYENRLSSSTSYHASLRTQFLNSLESQIKFHTDDYEITGQDLSFRRIDNRIEYTYQATIRFYVSMFGQRKMVYSQLVKLTASHVLKW